MSRGVDHLERIRRVLARFSYKPGTKLLAQARIAPPSGIELRVVCRRIDIDNPERETDVCVEAVIDETSSESCIETVVLGLLVQLEMHEVDEWLKFDGKHVRDPHPGERMRLPT